MTLMVSTLGPTTASANPLDLFRPINTDLIHAEAEGWCMPVFYPHPEAGDWLDTPSGLPYEIVPDAGLRHVTVHVYAPDVTGGLPSAGYRFDVEALVCNVVKVIDEVVRIITEALADCTENGITDPDFLEKYVLERLS